MAVDDPTTRIFCSRHEQKEAFISDSSTADSMRPFQDRRRTVSGINAPIEILYDQWGVPHIYATCSEDLFFGQGFVAAQDRLYQMELWRRARTGELAEVLGPDYLETDRLARLMKYRAAPETDWQIYGDKVRLIAQSFARGINAYITSCNDHLPFEFQVLGIHPSPWRAEDCLLRHFSPRTTFNAYQELARSELIEAMGLANAMTYLPTEPLIVPTVHANVNLAELSTSILIPFDQKPPQSTLEIDGSNCWAISGQLSTTGKPLLASDPHRPIVVPSLRYVCHLVAPGWNVIGAGEPALPGVALGHNERIAFGFTVAQFDQCDLYVETTAAHDENRYLADDDWADMTILRESVQVKGRADPVQVLLKFTRHGPVIWEDVSTNRALSLRWTGLEAGTAPYLGSIEVDRAYDWTSFRKALNHWGMPSENMVYADTDNNIGWIAAGLLPIRDGWEGLLPLSGAHGKFEWAGFQSIDKLPGEYNPACHYVASANHNIVPRSCDFVIGFDWKSPYRIERIRQVLNERQLFGIDDFMRLQTDEYASHARSFIQLLSDLPVTPVPGVQEALLMLSTWDCVLSAESATAAVFELWLANVRRLFIEKYLDKACGQSCGPFMRTDTLATLLRDMPRQAATELLMDALTAAVTEGSNRLGTVIRQWRWGNLHRLRLSHPLEKTHRPWPGPRFADVECGGDDETINSTRGPEHSVDYGPSYRQILDLSDWDRSRFVNLPGQSGDPKSVHYCDHLTLWRAKNYAPLLYSRSNIEKHTVRTLLLEPSRELSEDCCH